MFTDSVNESGVLQGYCSLASEDSVFGCRGTWFYVEASVSAAGGNSPFDAKLIQGFISAFERGVRWETPHYRCLLLPLGKHYGVLDHVKSISSESTLLVTIREGSLAFKNDLQLRHMKYRRSKLHRFQSVGISFGETDSIF